MPTTAPIDRPSAEQPENQQHDVGVGTDIHGAVFIVAGAAYIWLIAVAWVAFGSTGYIDLDLSFASVIVAMILGITLLVYAVAHSHLRKKRPGWDEFFNARVDTATGPMPGWQVALEIAVIPIVLAFGGTLIGIAWMLTPAGGASTG